MTILPVILAGGGGTRLWPLSREHYPKQILNLVGEDSLLQQALARLDGIIDNQGIETSGVVSILAPLVVCNEDHRFLVSEQLSRVERPSRRIILEPVGRNTAPALTVAALSCRDDKETDPIMLMMPADHVIIDKLAFQKAIALGYTYAEKNYLCTFGIVPASPQTAYGYIRLGDMIANDKINDETNRGYELDAFVEKPDAATAQLYLDSGNYLWNSGIFMMKASVWLKAIGKHRADILDASEKAYSSGVVDGDFYRLDKGMFEACPADSVDYAVMEKLTSEGKLKASVVPLDAGWSDVGSWSNLWEISDKDANGNVSKGDICAIDSKDNILVSKYRFVAALGCEGLVVVETADAVLVAPKERAEDVKRIVEWLKTQGREERLMHRRVYRPWGFYEGVDSGARFQVKRITVNPGEKLSLQMHHHRAEHWIVVNGTAKVVRAEEEFLLSENESTYIPLGIKHRLENPGSVPLELIEVQSGAYLGEDDIVRFEDVYNR